jgi:nitrite reductase (NADH) large subunit
MAGMACLDEILKRDPSLTVTVLSEEPYYNYNRILLSSVLAGEKTLDEIYINTKEWYEAHQIDLRLGCKAVDIDAGAKRVITAEGTTVEYDRLLLATGSNPFIPRMEGTDREGVFVFRNIWDTQGILDYCKKAKNAIVIGGGLLGLEAARGIANQGVQTTVVHLMDWLMERQIDAVGGHFLKKEITKMGIPVLLQKQTTAILGNGHVEGVKFKDQSELPADMVVIACGIVPNVELGKKAGLLVNRGIVVNDAMETSDPAIFAIGECVEHRGVTYGLVAPLYDQGKVLAATMTGTKDATYAGSVPATKLKVAGVELFSAGEFELQGTFREMVTYQDDLSGIYKKIVIENDKVVGCILVGDTSDSNHFLELMRKAEPLGERRKHLLFDKPSQNTPGSHEDVMARPDTDTICGCIGVTKGQIICAIREKNLTSVAEVKGCTKATSGCGTCAGLVEGIVMAVAGSQFQKDRKDILCACVPFPKIQLRQMVLTQQIKSVQDILDIYGNGTGCAACKPALSFLVDEVWLGDHIEDRSKRFINDRVHGNIQKDGLFSVVPRMRGGVTSPAELRKIADLADKYNVPMVKVTGSQRLDLLGVKKEDLPKIWAELEEVGLRSGFAYTKATRMVKTCVGTDFCRYGTQDSIATGIKLEEHLENLYTPAKVKMGCTGCPRNCAEATVKDIGLVGFEGGWQVVVGGAAGKRVREADILTTVKTSEEALEAAYLFFQYYRENGEYLERTYDFVERIGMDKVRRETILAPDEEKKRMLDRLNKAKDRAKDPWWEESKKPVHPMQFQELVLPKEAEALVL